MCVCLHMFVFSLLSHSGGKGHKGRWAHRVISYESSSTAATTNANGATTGNANGTVNGTAANSSGGSTLTGPCIHWHSSKLFSTERAGFCIRDITKVNKAQFHVCYQYQ
jgi:hypothetical protein